MSDPIEPLPDLLEKKVAGYLYQAAYQDGHDAGFKAGRSTIGSRRWLVSTFLGAFLGLGIAMSTAQFAMILETSDASHGAIVDERPEIPEMP